MRCAPAEDDEDWGADSDGGSDAAPELSQAGGPLSCWVLAGVKRCRVDDRRPPTVRLPLYELAACCCVCGARQAAERPLGGLFDNTGFVTIADVLKDVLGVGLERSENEHENVICADCRGYLLALHTLRGWLCALQRRYVLMMVRTNSGRRSAKVVLPKVYGNVDFFRRQQPFVELPKEWNLERAGDAAGELRCDEGDAAVDSAPFTGSPQSNSAAMPEGLPSVLPASNTQTKANSVSFTNSPQTNSPAVAAGIPSVLPTSNTQTKANAVSFTNSPQTNSALVPAGIPSVLPPSNSQTLPVIVAPANVPLPQSTSVPPRSSDPAAAAAGGPLDASPDCDDPAEYDASLLSGADPVGRVASAQAPSEPQVLEQQALEQPLRGARPPAADILAGLGGGDPGCQVSDLLEDYGFSDILVVRPLSPPPPPAAPQAAPGRPPAPPRPVKIAPKLPGREPAPARPIVVNILPVPAAMAVGGVGSPFKSIVPRGRPPPPPQPAPARDRCAPRILTSRPRRPGPAPAAPPPAAPAPSGYAEPMVFYNPDGSIPVPPSSGQAAEGEVVYAQLQSVGDTEFRVMEADDALRSPGSGTVYLYSGAERCAVAVEQVHASEPETQQQRHPAAEQAGGAAQPAREVAVGEELGYKLMPRACKLCNVELTGDMNAVRKHFAMEHMSLQRDDILGKTVYTCSACKQQSTSLELLKKHFGVRHVSRSAFMCSHCGHRYSRKEAVQQHVRRTHGRLDWTNVG